MTESWIEKNGSETNAESVVSLDSVRRRRRDAARPKPEMHFDKDETAQQLAWLWLHRKDTLESVLGLPHQALDPAALALLGDGDDGDAVPVVYEFRPRQEQS